MRLKRFLFEKYAVVVASYFSVNFIFYVENIDKFILRKITIKSSVYKKMLNFL